MLLIIVGVIAVAIVVVLTIAATKPDTFHLQRSTEINAPAAAIYANLSDFHRWQAWSPWEKLDPAMKRSFSGAEHGLGAVYAWDGNGKAGAGRMEVKEVNEANHLKIALDFMRPIKASNTVDFILSPHGSGTKVIWAMQGPLPYVAKIMHAFMNMEKMVGPDFEKGLSNLKALSEKP